MHLAAFPGPGEADLVDALRRTARLTLSRVGEVDGAVVGHVALSPVTVAGATGGLGLAPVAVLPEHQGRGLGGALVVDALGAARAQGAAFVVLLGDPGWYARFGFRPASTWGLHDAWGGGDAFQAVQLQPGALDGARGVVAYDPAFDDLG